MTDIIIIVGWAWVYLGVAAGLGVVLAAYLWLFPWRVRRLKELEDRIAETLGVEI